MAKAKIYGKKELADLGLKFIVANVPIFVIESSQDKVYRMKVELFDNVEQLKTNLSQIKEPLVIFDYTKVYPDGNIRINGDNDKVGIRGCRITFQEFARLIENIRNMTDVNYTFKWDFDNFNIKV